MARVTGIGGVFFQADDPEKLYNWYEKHLGFKRGPEGVVFRWRDAENPDREALTAWAIFRKNSGTHSLINYRVDDLDGLLKALRAAGVEIDPKREEYDFGRFAWIIDPEGNKIELWEPK